MKDQSLNKLRKAAKKCTACPLYKTGTQTVFGQGPESSTIMLVGEQPGDQEDLQGLPFVGPAGRILDQALKLAGIQREDIYLTNAVKHFKWKRAGKRRLHQKPNGKEISACHRWLEAEVAQVKPRAIVALGATAGQALLGRIPKVGAERGKTLDSSLFPQVQIFVTWHPSSILRLREASEKEARFKELAKDLKRVGRGGAVGDASDAD